MATMTGKFLPGVPGSESRVCMAAGTVREVRSWSLPVPFTGRTPASVHNCEAGFDVFVEEQCAKFYADGVGRPC